MPGGRKIIGFISIPFPTVLKQETLKKGVFAMCRRVVFFLAFTVSVFALFNAFAIASDFGCKALLCLASPKGPMQYAQCRPTIRKLYDLLYNRHPFPKCDTKSGDSNDSGIRVNEGVEQYVPCEEAYGEGYALTTVYIDNGSYSRPERICRKFIRQERKYICSDNGFKRTNCRWKNVAIYDDKPQKRRSEPYYLQVTNNGQRQGKRFYYKKKSKKKGGLF